VASDDPKSNASSHGEDPNQAPTLTWSQILRSSLAAGLGVQSNRNRERDFADGSPRRFIVMGVVLTMLFIASLVTVIRIIAG
jgi:hypothetical protein